MFETNLYVYEFGELDFWMELDNIMKKTCMSVFAIFLVLTFAMGFFINAFGNGRIVMDEDLSIGVVMTSLEGERELLLKDQFEVMCVNTDIQVRIQSGENSSKIQSEKIKEQVKSGINLLVVDAVSTRSKELEDSIRYAIDNEVRVVFLENKVVAFANKSSYVGFDSALVVGDSASKYTKLAEKTLDVCVNLYNGGQDENVCIAGL